MSGNQMPGNQHISIPLGAPHHAPSRARRKYSGDNTTENRPEHHPRISFQESVHISKDTYASAHEVHSLLRQLRSQLDGDGAKARFRPACDVLLFANVSEISVRLGGNTRPWDPGTPLVTAELHLGMVSAGNRKFHASRSRCRYFLDHLVACPGTSLGSFVFSLHQFSR